ncbi:DUF72 domain-containing protein [Pseudomonas sp. NW5]|uniref:DUF72 domain-containing protein n=1 Tax=Pseudomonas sp. NW5 TaxID=2934934 RepID=UPI0020226532|nr:DUF72 domain-containing protein [Pseudomonas sp. NW5]
MLPYYLGCPSWNEPAWRGSFYPAGLAAHELLGAYCQRFNTVEGNTTFYARPAAQTLQRWAEQMPADFHFCAKLPRDISHAEDLREQLPAAQAFLDLLSPLGARITPLWLQLPARFSPARLGELAAFIDALAAPALAVEVRHLAFFARGEEERALNRLLHARGVERICLDSRALFRATDRSPAVLHAQARKPRLPLRPAAFSATPQVRFIGHPQQEANAPFLAPWVEKTAQWIEVGLQPHIFLHTPDNQRAPQLAQYFHELLMARLPGLPALPEPAPGSSAATQLDLL